MTNPNKGRLGLVSVTFRQLSAEQIIEVAKSAGLQVLEWGGDVHVPAGDTRRAREVAALTREAGLETICYGSYYRVGHEGEGGQPGFSAVLETAVALGAPSIRVWAGTRGSEAADGAYFIRVCDDANRIADLAAAQGVRIAFEFHGGTLNDRAGAAAKFLETLSHSNIDTLWQPLVSLDAGEHDRSLQVVLPRLAHVHVFHWLPGDPIDRRPLAEGAPLWRDWFATMRGGGRRPDALFEFCRGDDPGQLAADAAVLRGLVS
jgi:sugar phosphate isomerase/epimerase